MKPKKTDHRHYTQGIVKYLAKPAFNLYLKRFAFVSIANLPYFDLLASYFIDWSFSEISFLLVKHYFYCIKNSNLQRFVIMHLCRTVPNYNLHQFVQDTRTQLQRSGKLCWEQTFEEQLLPNTIGKQDGIESSIIRFIQYSFISRN